MQWLVFVYSDPKYHTWKMVASVNTWWKICEEILKSKLSHGNIFDNNTFCKLWKRLQTCNVLLNSAMSVIRKICKEIYVKNGYPSITFIKGVTHVFRVEFVVANSDQEDFF